MGAGNKAKGRVCRRQTRQAPPQGTTATKSISAANGLMPGCRGRSPRRNKVKISPFPTGEGGRGDRGQEIKLTAGREATKTAKPPCGYHSGKVCRQPAGQAPRKKTPPNPRKPGVQRCFYLQFQKIGLLRRLGLGNSRLLDVRNILQNLLVGQIGGVNLVLQRGAV